MLNSAAISESGNTQFIHTRTERTTGIKNSFFNKLIDNKDQKAEQLNTLKHSNTFISYMIINYTNYTIHFKFTCQNNTNFKTQLPFQLHYIKLSNYTIHFRPSWKKSHFHHARAHKKKHHGSVSNKAYTLTKFL